MPRRMPKRGPHGEFVRGNASTVAQQEESKEKPVATPRGRTCEECGEELTEHRVAVHGGRIKIEHCPKCIPEPLEAIRGD